jgi:hypothetical protein
MPLSPFIITTLKDTYNSILGMPWIVKHSHLIDWKACRFLTNHPRIAAANAASSSPTNTPDGTQGKARLMDKGVCVLDMLAPPQCKHNFLPSPLHRELAGQQDPLLQFEQTQTMDPWMSYPRPVATAMAVSSDPQKPSDGGMEPGRHARLTDEGVCAYSALKLLQCESNSPSLFPLTESAGKPLPSLEQANQASVDVSRATSWSTLAQLVAESKRTEAPRLVEQLFPQAYHKFLRMFQKTDVQSLPPH